ncbi:MAG: amidohydrolase [Alphaproteobacteria bacterium]|nr:amidohydrolase [Alphaproteobacteria bacterium]
MTASSPSAAVREKLNHPIIDADAHLMEVEPVLLDYLKEVAGPRVSQRYADMWKDGRFWGWYQASAEERVRRRIKRAPFWAFPAANTEDRATAMLPSLLRARLEEFGIDFCMVYPTVPILYVGLDDEELRRAVSRAANLMNRDLFADHRDRLAPAAVIPMHTPAEAIAELDFAVGQLGFKAVMVEGVVRRRIEDDKSSARDSASPVSSYWIDPLGLDSIHDYDAVWQRCLDLKVAPSMHTSTMGWADRTSISNFTYNHIGHFAAGSHAFCKGLVLGGVTRRFPTLKFAFLECGVGWAASLYNDLIEHWEKRNVPAMRQTLDPATIDRQALATLVAKFGHPRIQAHLDRIRAGTEGYFYGYVDEREDQIDDFTHAQITKKRDIYRRFIPNFYFGCEADDRIVAFAFDKRLHQFGARFKAMLGSDIGHFDVTDARTVIAEAHELVEAEIITPEDFRDFVFGNVAELHAGMNPDLYKGTVVEDAVAQRLATAQAAE